MGDIITVIVLLIFLLMLLYMDYRPSIDIIRTGVRSYRVYLWYNSNMDYTKRTYKLIYDKK